MTNFGPILRTARPGPDEIFVAGQQLGLAVVEHQAVDPPQHAQQFVALDVDPQVHRVGDDQRRAGRSDRALSFAATACRWPETETSLGEIRAKAPDRTFQHVEMNFERFAVVHVRQILAAPAKRLAAGNDLQARRVDAAIAKHSRVFGRPILAHGAEQMHSEKKRAA